MILRSIKSLFAALLLLPLSPATAPAQETVSNGVIAEMGCGKFRLKESKDMVRLYMVKKKVTHYDPSHWRPEAGDQVSVQFFQKKGNLVAGQVQLVKLGPNNIDPNLIVSPLRVTIRETGKTGLVGTLKGSSKPIRFSIGRKKPAYEPVGWLPAAGAEAEIEFTVAKTGGITGIIKCGGINYALDKVTYINK